MRVPNCTSAVAILSLMLGAAYTCPAAAADVEEASSQTPLVAFNWTCWRRAGRIVCELESPPTGEPDPAGTVGTTDPISVEPIPAELPLPDPSGQLPPLVKQLREHPEQLSGRRIAIPTHSEPRDALAAEELASAVVCSIRPDCRVIFLGSLAEVVLYLDQHSDPALQ